MTWSVRRWLALAGCLALTACGAAEGSSPAPGISPSAAAVATPSRTSVTSTPSPIPTPTPESPSSPTSPATATTPSAAPTPSTTATTATPAVRPVIVIDPGHSGRAIRSRTVNGLLDYDYPNTPEITEMFDVSSCVAEGLRADGYRVIMTKRTADDSVSLTERAAIANRAGADLAVSLHDDHSQSPSFQATYSQRGVAVDGRYPTMYRGTGDHRTVFDDPTVAKASEHAAIVIARERTKAQGRPVTVRQNSFTGRPPLEPGNLALVQLLADVPWVYNEAGAMTGGDPSRRLSLAAETAYAKGVLDGIEAAVPVQGGDSSTSTAQLQTCLAARR